MLIFNPRPLLLFSSKLSDFLLLEMKILIHIFFFYLMMADFVAKAQQLSGGARPSIVVTRGYSVTTVVSALSSKDVQGSQLEADNSINVNIVNPVSPPSQAGDIANFMVSPNSSLVELGEINHSSLIEFGEGTSMKTLVQTKEDAVLDGEISKASSKATIIVETELRAQENALKFSESFDNAF